VKRRVRPTRTRHQPALTDPRLGSRLIAEQLIGEEDLNSALAEQSTSHRPLGEILTRKGALDEEFLTSVLSEQLSTPTADLHRAPIDPDVARLVPEHYARRHVVLPLRRSDGWVEVAMADPANVGLVNDVRLLAGAPITPLIAGRSDILVAISSAYSMQARIQEAARTFDEARSKTATTAQRMGIGVDLAQITAESPVVEVVNLLITQGLRDRASDIHIEPQEDYLRVRFRIDGVLQDVAHLPASIGPGLSSRIKIMADLNIVERHRSQDGQISLTVEGMELDIRVASMGTIWGEKLVMRLLDRSRSLISLEGLGFSSDTYESYEKTLHSPYGMIIVAGPTGSGKTTTLYASLQELDNQQKNIVTIEDPVEYTFANINQTQINKLADITFANGLRAVLRQDPDVILVGEIRDRETAEIAVQSALTGHLVLSSLHATSTVGALLRFIDMGIEGFLISSSVIGIVAQRLVRKVCETCKREYEPTQDEVQFGQSLGVDIPKRLYHGHGCGRCNLTGYFDRIGVYENLPINDEIKRLVIDRAGEKELRKAALDEGMVPLRRDAWDKATKGITTVQEIIRSVYTI
jgi:type IV pilus assembly protein PilB